MVVDQDNFLKEDPACQIAWGAVSKSESRWPASLAVLFGILVTMWLPEKYEFGPGWLMPALELAILVPLTVAAPRRVAHEGPIKQVLAITMIAIISFANLASLILLIYTLLYNGKSITGTELIFSAVKVWITNVIVFALWYWEIDRGGPDQRTHLGHSAPDFLFPQMSTPGTARADWTPAFIDYLYLAFTNATAFSPTDAMPLTPLAKTLMLGQSVVSLVTVTIVAARAVNILG